MSTSANAQYGTTQPPASNNSPPGGNSLPFTGMDIIWPVVLGVAMMAFGGMLRRRARSLKDR